MKKILSICLVLVMLACFSAVALATSETFVKSPSGVSGPKVVKFEPSNSDCIADLVLTPYVNKSNLATETEELMDKAHDTVTESDDLSKLCSDFADFLAKKNLTSKNIAVSDLFDLSCVGCENHFGHHTFRIALSADTLQNFVALLHMDKSGEWELIDNAKVSDDFKELEFEVDSFSPFAIVVKTSDNNTIETNDKKTGDNITSVLIVGMVATLAGVVFVAAKKKTKVTN